MKLETLQNSRYKELARRFKQLKKTLILLEPRKDQDAREEYKKLFGKIYELVESELTEATAARMKLALVEHTHLAQGIHNPVLHELRNPDTFVGLTSVDIGLLFEAYGEYGRYQKTVALDRALSRLAARCDTLYHRRRARQETVQTGLAR